MGFKLILLLSLLVVSSCGERDRAESPDHTQAARDVAAQKARWAAVGPQSYRYSYEQFCNCPWSGEILVTVTDRVITSAVTVADNSVIPADRYQYLDTVDQAFTRIENAIANNAARLTVTYDATLGYPTAFSVDQHLQVMDDEYGAHIWNLVPL